MPPYPVVQNGSIAPMKYLTALRHLHHSNETIMAPDVSSSGCLYPVRGHTLK